jgi:hypothetical protein
VGREKDHFVVLLESVTRTARYRGKFTEAWSKFTEAWGFVAMRWPFSQLLYVEVSPAFNFYRENWETFIHLPVRTGTVTGEVSPKSVATTARNRAIRG